MVTALTNRFRLTLLLGGIGLLLAAPTAARGDELQYLPDDCHLVASLNYQDFLKSKTYQELKKQIPEVGKNLEGGLTEGLGIPGNNLARITSALSFGAKPGPEPQVGMLNTIKAIKAEDIKANKKIQPWMKNHAYKEVKVGTFTLYQQTYQFEINGKIDDKVLEGPAFCVVEDKLVLFGSVPDLKKILERNKKPALAANLQAGMKEANFSNVASFVLDIQGMPQWAREEMAKNLSKTSPAIEGLAEQVKLLAIKVNEDGQVKGSATLFCKDAAGAGKVHKAAAMVLADLKSKLKDDPTAPAPKQELIKGARMFIEAVKLSDKGEEATATVAVEPAAAAHFLTALFAPVGPPTKEQPKDKN